MLPNKDNLTNTRLEAYKRENDRLTATNITMQCELDALHSALEEWELSKSGFQLGQTHLQVLNNLIALHRGTLDLLSNVNQFTLTDNVKILYMQLTSPISDEVLYGWVVLKNNIDILNTDGVWESMIDIYPPDEYYASRTISEAITLYIGVLMKENGKKRRIGNS